MRVRVTWVEEWQRTAVIDVDDEAAGRTPAELAHWLDETAIEDSASWLPSLPNLDVTAPDVEFWSMEVQRAEAVSDDHS